MQTRGAAKRAASASSSTQPQADPKITSLFTTTKRAAKAALQEKTPEEVRPRKKVKRATSSKESLPADELPHGLGRIHVPSKETTENPVDGPGPADASSSFSPASSHEGEEYHAQKNTALEYSGLMSAETFSSSLTNSSPAMELARVLRPRPQKQETEVPALPKNNPGAIEALKVIENAAAKVHPDNKRKRIARRTQDNPYGLMPGRTPFPDWPSPSFEECIEVHRILTEMHGEFKAPEKIPAPSTSIAGCGEVPDIVDALIRTLISGHTSMQNANLAIQDVVAKYGQWDIGSIGAGSIEWNKVRLSEESTVIDAIKRAGLGPTKGKDIKSILDLVYQDNQQRLAAYIKERETGELTGVKGARQLTQGQKDHQMKKMESGILTLDHIRSLTSDEAMLEFTKYPGIGVKTSSCLILFCLQQPSFAVDTHVWRFCKWLKWVPPKASRDDTYMHGEVRIPDNLKYGLHQLFIRHGKECGRCRTVTVEGTADWDSVECPLESLLDRFDKRKTKALPKKEKGVPELVESNEYIEQDDIEGELQMTEELEDATL